ncbi:MAG: potassium channel family protein, partial [Asgard group archaeon]
KRVEIARKSPLSDQTLKELDLKNNLGVFVIAIRRGKEWIFKPRGSTVIRPGDTLICKCFEESVETFEKIASGEITEF